MSAPSDRRFEVVQSDAAQPWSVREMNYAQREGALRALATHISWLHPRLRVWLSNGTGGPQLRVGMPDDTYRTARLIELRDVDERADRSRPGLGTAGVTGAQPDEPVTQAGRPATGGAG